MMAEFLRKDNWSDCKVFADTLYGCLTKMGAGKSQFTEEELQDYQVRLFFFLLLLLFLALLTDFFNNTVFFFYW